MSKSAKSYSGVYLILSLKWSDGKDHLIWWQADNSGYTSCVDKAGRYTAEQVAGNPGYYDNDSTTRAVPLYNVLEGLLGPIHRIVASTYRRPRKSVVCHCCHSEFDIDPDYTSLVCRRCKDPVCDICYDEERCPVGAELDLDQHGRHTVKEP